MSGVWLCNMAFLISVPNPQNCEKVLFFKMKSSNWNFPFVQKPSIDVADLMTLFSVVV